MSSEASAIACRRCGETFQIEAESCPHCGASIRSTTKLAAVGVIGALMAVVSVFQIGSLWVFGLLGLAMAGISGYLIYKKRERMQTTTAGVPDGDSAV